MALGGGPSSVSGLGPGIDYGGGGLLDSKPPAVLAATMF
jgi:hypothetical protein